MVLVLVLVVVGVGVGGGRGGGGEVADVVVGGESCLPVAGLRGGWVCELSGWVVSCGGWLRYLRYVCT